MEGSSAATDSTGVVLEVRGSKLGRTHGKAWKSEKSATRRSQAPPSLKTPFEKRMERETAKKAIKAVETDMKEEAQAARER